MADRETMYHWRRLDDRITTSGQPTEPQLEEIHALGIRHIVNLVEGRAGARPLHRERSGFGLLLYRYRRDVLGMDEARTRADMEEVSHPEGVWARRCEPLAR